MTTRNVTVNHHNSPNISSEIGITVFLILIVTEFLSIFQIVPHFANLAFNTSIGSMLSNLVILGLVLGSLGFLTLSRESLMAGLIASLFEVLTSALVAIKIFQGQLPLEMWIQTAGIGVIAIIASYYSFIVVFIQVNSMTRLQNQLHDRKDNVVLELIKLSKYYYIGADIVVKALDEVSFKIHKGEMVAIMGPSGSGKSTLLNLLGLLDTPTSGNLNLDGQDISKMNAESLALERNSKIGFIFQSYNLLNRTSVIKNVELPSIVNLSINKTERQERGKKFLTMLGLEKEILRKPKTLSGGQQQRVAIARALMNDPSIILADEPTGNLDSKNGNMVMDLLQRLNREHGITVIIVTHDREVANYANRIIYLKDGKVASEKVSMKPMNGEVVN